MREDGTRIYFQAPMSYGKTITGLAASMLGWEYKKKRVGELWFVFAQPSVLDVWLKEAVRIFGKSVYESKSAKSAILMSDSPSNAAGVRCHRAVVRGNQYSKRNHLVLCSTGRVQYKHIRAGQKYNLIYDECHKSIGDIHRRYVKNANSVLFMSASGPPQMQTSYRTVVVPEQCVKNNVPQTRFHYIQMSEDDVRRMQVDDYHHYVKKNQPDRFRAAIEEKADAIFSIIGELFEKHFDEKIAVFCDDFAIECIAARLASLYGKNKPVFKLRGSTTVISRMENTSNGVLVAGQARSESININSSVMIIFQSDTHINKERRNQLVGRCVRTTNKAEFVDVYHVVTGRLGYLKCRHSDAFFNLRIRMTQDPVSVSYFLSVFRILCVVDKGLKKVTDADIVALVGDGVKIKQKPKEVAKTLEWWRYEKSMFTEKMQRKLLYYPLLEIPE
jgi:hypothetical protein